MPKRWYDKEATLSLAISMLKNASLDIQESTCELLTQKFNKMGIKKSSKFIVFKMFDKRWYDERESVYNVLETIRCCNATQRKKIALCIIDHLCEIAIV